MRIAVIHVQKNVDNEKNKVYNTASLIKEKKMKMSRIYDQNQG